MKKQIIVYTTHDCIECEMVKKVLTEEGLPFEIRNISLNPQFINELDRYGFLGVPVTISGERAVKGFTNEIKELIEEAKATGFTYD